ncbi:ABC transporter ATP-binding protein [Haloferax mediterranei ATCC 33500]|uniref:ABC transporter ATP-binding protein n=1 Tax=Haloferax mediterranei (strain ATCC 33500 / DSM 1411 / JCM 8866 / NBRC 14739 / NCIMB 2177 / R-4) TaxID=523841 RepID=I3R5M3_HALMT|nr:ABC transporter ATP-binding protein [Haloferax mediterranei]AFK19533.1 branched-chain amino acid ABC transporter ATP-binding protein [Haloferax mediterranei ATCC 33500]AHZ22928.1 branched-chain amino acid ABC transporter ATP-binding protein [Haloferax mediterranei ATCC 33500]ELZ99853.1 branched-chain amino acid ABC transporter ATP-binding protein [Haloferax mediterranei ATCC 33500]MDX5987725.1 ABC transporter ATP-binding protein [Haloferax mediterranei ATCC 33500]QCQ74206.1 ABC transporter 
MLRADSLQKSFGSVRATDDVTVEFGRTEGEMVFIVGPNGAGKTTLINLLTGHLEPDSGRVLLDEEDVTQLSPDERVHAGLVRSFQVVKLFEEMTVRENVRTAVLSKQRLTRSMFSLKDEHDGVESTVDGLIDNFGLAEHADTVAEELAHGTRKLLDVAMSFGLDPEYLLLDEPTAGVSTREKEYVIDTIAEVSREEGVTTVTIEHDMDIVTEYADRVVALHQGGIHGEGPPAILETDDELRRLLLGVEA